MVTTYTVLKTIHVLAAVYWIGGAAVLQVQALRARRSREPGQIARFLGDAEFIGQRTFLPASLILIVTAILMMVDGNLDFELWIVLGIIAWLTTTILGAAFLGPQSGKLGELVAREGDQSPAVQARFRQLFLVARIDLTMLVLIIVDMVIKPGT